MREEKKMIRLRKIELALPFVLACILIMGWDGPVVQAAEIEEKLGEVVVTATRSEKEITVAPASVNVVTKEEIEKRNILTVDQSLNALPGVFDRRGKGLMDTQSSITLRGIPNQNRTLILRDGIPLNNAYTGDVQWGALAPEDIERVEVVKGPFSSLYGGNAMGGVVNIITKMPGKREFTVKSGYGTSWTRGEAMDDLQKYYLSYGDNIKDKLSLFLSYGYKGTNGYPTDLNVQSAKPPASITGWSTTTDNQGNPRYLIGDKGDNRWWDDNLNIKAGYSFSKESKLNLSFLRTQYKYVYEEPHTFLKNAAGNPVFSYGTVRESSFLSGLGYSEQNVYNVSFQTEVSAVRVNFSLGLVQQDKPWYITPATTATRTGGPGTLSETASENYYADLQFDAPLGERQILTLGGSYRHDWSDTQEHRVTYWKDEKSVGDLTFQSRGWDQTFAFFIQDEITILENLTAYLGFREDWWQTRDGYSNSVGAAGYPKTFDARNASSFNPKASLVYKPFEQTTLRASGGKAFRAPTVYELYRTWVSSSGVTYAGSPDLKPEITWSWDVGVEQGLWKGAKVKAAYFENYLSDLIYRNSISPTLQQNVNVGEATVKGVEAEAEQRFANWLRVFGTLTWNDAKVTKNDAKPEIVGKRLTFMPEWLYSVGVDFTMGPFSAYLIGRYASKMYSNDENRDTVEKVYGSYDPYFLADATVSYKIMKWAKISFSVNNIFDEDYFFYYKTPGRSCFGELTLQY
jgi:iron complex outermembrane receptor protein